MIAEETEEPVIVRVGDQKEFKDAIGFRPVIDKVTE
jgi:hypothetical protein